jgi:hypothetical protein
MDAQGPKKIAGQNEAPFPLWPTVDFTSAENLMKILMYLEDLAPCGPGLFAEGKPAALE